MSSRSETADLGSTKFETEMATVGDEVVDAVVVEAVEEAVVVAERLTTVGVPATMAGVAEVATG